jgi:uncharacterized protein with HEPN domain
MNQIGAYIHGIEYEEFLGDRKTQDAVVRNIEIIGEASKHVSEHLKKKYPQVPWKDFARLRDKVIHFYSGVNYDIVWDVATNELPKALKQIRKILEAEAQ